jgi:hypothetical protein
MCEKKRAFVHESGHVIIAVLRDIFFSGVCYVTGEDKYCTLISGPSSLEHSKYYPFLAAGMAAELVVYGDYDEEAAGADKADFMQPGAPPLQQTVSEVQAILRAHALQIDKLASTLLEKDNRKQDFPEVGMDCDVRRFRVLLTKAEAEAVINP